MDAGALLDWAVKSVQSCSGANSEIDCARLHLPGSGWLILVRLRPKIIVNIQRIDLRLAVHPSLLGVSTVQFHQIHRIDRQGTARGSRDERLRLAERQL